MRLPNTVVIAVHERVPSILWITQDTAYTMDRSGVITERIDEIDIADPNFPQAYDLSNSSVRIGDDRISADLVEYLFTIRKTLPIDTDLDIEYFLLPGENDVELRVQTTEGWNIYFDRTITLERQIENLVLLLERRFTDEQRKNLKYIDLRYDDRVYFK